MSMRWESGIRIAVSAAVVALLLGRIPTFALWSAFRGLDVLWLWPALTCVLAMLAVRYFKWHRLLQSGNLRSLPDDSARSLFGGLALSVITPGRMGEFGRCMFVAQSDRAAVLLLTIFDRSLDLWALLTCAVFSLFFVASRPAAIFAGGVWLAFLPVVLGLPSLIASPSSWPRWVGAYREQLAAARQILVPIRAGRFAAAALASTLLELMAFFFSLRAFHRVDFSVAAATFPWIVMAGDLPVSLGGIGLREGAAALMLSTYGFSSAAAINVTLFLYGLSVLLPALLGTLGLVAHRHRQALLRVINLSKVLERGERMGASRQLRATDAKSFNSQANSGQGSSAILSAQKRGNIDIPENQNLSPDETRPPQFP